MFRNSLLAEQRQLTSKTHPKRQRGIDLGRIPRWRFGLVNHGIERLVGAIQLGTTKLATDVASVSNGSLVGLKFIFRLFLLAAVNIWLPVFVGSNASGENAYVPRLVDPLHESWRWREFPQLKGRGLNCIDEAPDGAMWFGINQGALRYDGLQWSEFNEANGLPTTATSFASTDSGFYASTRSAIYALNNERWTEVFPGTTDRVWVIEDLIAAKDGSLWVATNWGALQISSPQLSASSQQWTVYATPQVIAYFDTDQPTRFKTVVVDTPESKTWRSGCGVHIYGPVPNGQTIIDLAEDGPAAKAGLKIGDQIVGINGESRLTVYQKEVDANAGSELELTVKRPGETNSFNVKLTAVADVPGEFQMFRPYSIAEAMDGSIWFATRLGKLISLSSAKDGQRKWTHHTDEHDLPNVAVPSITATADGVAAVGRSTNTKVLIQFDGQQWQQRNLDRGIGASITTLQDGSLLVGSNGAVIAVRSNIETVQSTQLHGIAGNDVLVKQTVDGAIWIAGKGSTVQRVEPQGRTWTSYEGLTYEDTAADGSEWFLSDRLTVIQRDGEKWREFTFDDGLMTIPTTVLATKSGDVWASGSHNGIAATARLSNGKWTLQEHPRLSWMVDRRSALEDRDGRVWFGAATVSSPAAGMVGGVLRFDGAQWKHIEPTNRLTYSYQIAQTQDGSMWVSGPSLVQILPNDRFGNQSLIPDKAHGFCDCCATDLDGNLWVGTRNHGLMKLSRQRDGQWSDVWFDESNGISNNRVRNVLPLADGTIVAHTVDGFHRYDSKSWTQPAFPEALATKIDYDGIRQSPMGAIWFNTSAIGDVTPQDARSGRIEFAKPGSVRTYRYVADSGSPQTQLDSNVSEIHVGDDGLFSWSGWDPWNVTEPSQLTYSWRVDGKEWSPFSTETVAKISDLPSGSHQLEVRSRDKDFNIDATPAVVSFDVIPQLHNRTWFRLLMLFTSGMLFIAIVQTGRVFRREATLRITHGELVAAERQLQMANFVLEDRVAQRTHEQEQTNQRLLREFEERVAADNKLRASEQRYRSLVEMLPNGVQRIDLQGRVTFGNQMLATMHGCQPEGFIGRHIWDFEVNKQRRQSLQSFFMHLVEHQPSTSTYESTNRTVDGRIIEIEAIWTYDRDADGHLLGFISVISDVTERKSAEELIRAENVLLEAVARGEPQSQTLEQLTAFVETQSPGILASVLLLDDDGLHLRHGAGSSLPLDYRLAIDGGAIGEAAGSCGTAAYRGEAVFAHDIANDPLWKDYSELALAHGLASCWSTPIKDTDGSVLGTFAIYNRQPATPTAHQQRLMEIVTHLASVTIGRSRSQEALRNSERLFRSMFEQAAIGVARINSNTGEFILVNQRYCDMLGYRPTELSGETFQNITHPDDLQADLDNMARLRAGQIHEFSMEKRYRHKNGGIVWGNLTVSPLWRAGETPTYHVAIVEEITKRKEAEFSLLRRDQILGAASSTATQMLGGSGWKNLLDQMLRDLGQATEVSRAYLFECHHSPDQQLLCSQIAEWTDSRIEPQIGNPALQNSDFANAGLGRWLAELADGRPIFGHVDDFPLSERKTLVPLHIRSLCVLPIRVADRLWGFIGFDQCHERREWSETEVNTLRIAADTLSAAVLRSESDAALRESEQRFRTIFEQAAVGVAQIHSVSGKLLRVNQLYCEILGLPEKKLVGRTWMELTPPDDLEVDHLNMDRLIKGEIRAFNNEKRIERTDGAVIWIDLNVSPMWQPGEVPTDHIAIVQDITQRKNDEFRQRQMFNRNQGLVSALGEIVFDWNPTTDQILWDGNFTEILGYSLEEMGGGAAAWIGRIHPDETDLVADVIKAAQENLQPYEIEFRVRCRDGTYRWVHNRGVLAIDDEPEPSRIIGVLRDISQRKRAEVDRERRHRSLVQLDECVRQLFATVRSIEPFFDVICQDIESLLDVDLCAVPMIDPNGTSFTYRAATGRKAEMIVGRTMPVVGGGLCGWVIESHQTLCVTDLSSDPRAIPELAIALDVTTAILAPLSIEGRVIGGLSVFRKGEPFTDFELRTLNLYAQSVAAAYENWLTLNKLEQRVVERTAELAETNAELESFARTVSHDLRAPLRAMEGFAAALDEDYGHQIDAEGHEFIQHIINSARRMDAMVSDLLSYSRLGRTELRVTPLGLNEIVREALNRLSSEIEAKNATFHVADDMLTIAGHRSTLAQIVTNMISNAVKFVPTGVRPEIRIWSEHEARNRVRLYIQDNGIGVDGNYHKRIFNVFERLHGIESYPGTGIGLAIVARACERLGGTYGLESNPGQGSKFWIEFPKGAIVE